jgi:hypothetical protein
MSLITIFNETSPHAHTKSELDVLGVHGKLVKYIIHSSKKIKLKRKEKFLAQAAKMAID